MVSPLRGLVRGDPTGGSAALVRRFTPGYLWCRLYEAFLQTTYTAAGYIVVNEKLNFLPKRVYKGENIACLLGTPCPLP
jgi:hypothetical protein